MSTLTIVLITCAIIAIFLGICAFLFPSRSHSIDRYSLHERVSHLFPAAHAPTAELAAAILIAQTGIEIDDIEPGMSFHELNIHDDFHTVEYRQDIESAFEILIPDCEANAIHTFGALVHYLYVVTSRDL